MQHLRSFLLCVAAQLFAASCIRAQQPDADYARLVKEYTSDPRFLPAVVSSLPTSATIPSPQKHFGTIIGAPGVMHRADDVYGYFRALAAATPRVKLEKVGTSEEGRDIMLVIVADDATMQKLDAYKRVLARLADPRTVSVAQLDALLDQAKPVYYFNAGLHSPEMGSPEMVMELAYRLAVGDDPQVQKIRDNVITLINPVSEPDGRDKQVDWYLHYTKGRKEYDDGFERSSPYWGKYVLHDNNRDGIQVSQALTRAIYDVFYAWHPLVMHDLHESVPLLYISTGTGPYGENYDPITISEWQLLANNDLTALSAAGLPGVWTWGFFDGWWPGYATFVANNHNAVGRFYETFGNAGADTYVRDLSTARYSNELITSRQWYRAWPPTKKVRWSARDNVNYMEAGVLASLSFTADNGRTLLRNFWQKGQNSMTRGREQKPYAFVIPGMQRQRDPARVAYLVNQLRRQAIEVRERNAPADSSGDLVVLLDQPYRDLAVNLLSKQTFPSTALYPPYDDIAWTLGYLYGVDVNAVNDSAVFHWNGLQQPLSTEISVISGAKGNGTNWVFPYRGQAEVLPALYWLKKHAPKARAFALESAVPMGKDTLPVGSLLIEDMPENTAMGLAQSFSMTLKPFAIDASVKRHELDLPRVAIYHNWDQTQNEGWARFTFDQAGVPYAGIDKDDVRRGKLRARFDVILMPAVSGSAASLVHEVDDKFGPIAYTKTKDTPALGVPFSSPDITGGPGFQGMAELSRFVEDGGTLVTLFGATSIAAETGLARTLGVHTTRTLFHPGSIVRTRVRHPENPIVYGYPATTTVFRGNGPIYEVDRRDSAYVVMQFGTKVEEKKDEGPMLGMPETAHATAAPDSAHAAPKPTTPEDYVVSGMVRGQDEIIGQPAIISIPMKKGHVVAFDFNPLHRFLNHHEFPMVWNTLLNWNDLP
jgi:hypothetical protein